MKLLVTENNVFVKYLALVPHFFLPYSYYTLLKMHFVANYSVRVLILLFDFGSCIHNIYAMLCT